MTDLPTGTLTLLFTDIEGSTRLLSRLGTRYAELVSAQRVILRRAFERWGGQEMGTEGDSFFVVFRSVADALAAATQAQQDIAAATWPEGVTVGVRMGLHTGEPTPHEDSYVGMDVHRAARVAASAHGGQVVLTEASYRIAAGHPAAGTGFVDLGRHRLKDLPAAEHIYQLTAPGLATAFPPLKSLGAGTSLPTATTALVGRRREVGALTALLSRDGARLVTLTGPAGTGKTRLALAVADSLGERFADGVYFVPLAPVTTADVMWTTVAEALGVTGEGKAPPTFREHLAQQDVLLVLDNLEQLPEAADVVGQLLGAGPGVHVLATSRRPLHLGAEHEFPVAPLPVPGPGDATAAGAAGATGGAPADADEDEGAVELFVRRAELVRPGFRLDASNIDDVREICRRLDGLPLAVELVAARVKLLSPRALRARLDDALEMSTRAVDAPERQQNLRSALAWSYRLLPEDLQRAFRRLGVVAGDVDLAAVGEVIGTGRDPLDDAAELVDVNLLVAFEGPDGEPRFRMLRTIALYARDLLGAADEDEDQDARRRHAEHFAGVARTWCPQLRGEHHLTAKDHVERELEELRAALAWALDPAAAPDDGTRLELGLGLCEQLGWFWYGCGYQAEGRRWLQAAVDAAGRAPSGTRTPEVMNALHGLGVLVLQHGEAERARDLLERCVAFWREEGDLAPLSRELNSLAMAYRSLGEPDRAQPLIEEAVAVAQASGHQGREANALSNLAALQIDAGRYDDAIVLLRQVLVLDTALQDAWGQGADHVNIAGALLRAGRVDEAHAHLRDSTPAAVALGDVEITVDVIGLFCALHALRGDAERAARLLGASDRMREQAEMPMPLPDAQWLESVLAPVREGVDRATWEQDVARGAGYSVEVALAEAMR